MLQILFFAGLASLLWLDPLPELTPGSLNFWFCFACGLILVNLFLARRWVRQGHALDRREIPWDVAVITGPILEEVIFRGFGLRVMGLFIDPQAALAFSSLWFMVGHKRPRTVGYDFGLGVLFGLLAIYVGIWAAIVAHASWNAMVWQRGRKRRAERAAEQRVARQQREEKSWEDLVRPK